MGILQGLTLAEMRERFPIERAAFEQTGPDYVIPEGESSRQRSKRSAEVMTTIANRHADATVVVITHGEFLMGFLEFVLNVPFGNGWRFKRYSVAYNVFEYPEDRWTLHSWNDISHLEGMTSLDDRTVQTVESAKTVK